MWVLEKLVCPAFFLVPGDARTDGRPANKSVPPKPPENGSNRSRQAAQPKDQSFSFSLSPVVFSRPVRDRSPKESRFSLSRLSTARHSSPKPPENRSNRRRRQHSPSTRVFLSLSPLVFSRLVPSATDPPGVSLRSLSLSLSSVYCAAPFSNPRAL